MNLQKRLALKHVLFLSTALGGISTAGLGYAQTADAQPDDQTETVIVTAEQTTRSSFVLGGQETQKLLPGINPLKAIETLPGVVFETADPWGNNEQNESLVVHGFTTQQLGYTMDGVPLGDQQYGAYDGLSPSRAVSSENVDRVDYSSGTGSLGVASTSNLGGVIETFSRSPSADFSVLANETAGSYETDRTFARLDTGDLGGGNAAYVSFLHQDARAWDFHGDQRGYQMNAKFVHDDANGKFTFYADWQTKVEPNEDALDFGNQQTASSTYFPYTRPYLYPNYTAALAYVNPVTGAPPSVYGNNFSNYFSAAQREDWLSYAQYDWNLASNLTWSNQIYYHYEQGRGIVAGPINQAGLPGLFTIYQALYFPGESLSQVFGGTGYEVRTTEYLISREGERSTLDWQLGDHQIEAGLWFENNNESQGRKWYPFSAANDDLTPYEHPGDPAFTQYYFRFTVDDLQLHVQDQWHVLPNLTLQAGWKASLQNAANTLPVQQANIVAGSIYTLPPYNLKPTSPPVNYPIGGIASDDWFLPQVGAIWNITDNDDVFANIQKNMRQFIPYGAGSNFYGTSPWSLGSQEAFNTFKATAHPETSWTFEGGVRTQRTLDWGWLTGIEGQASYYHVEFSNRLLNVATYNFINPNPAILVNVGSVTTNGVDIAGTLQFGEHFQFYDAISYNRSVYDDNYQTVSGGVLTTVPIAGKVVPLTPDWLEKFILSAQFGRFEAQFNGDYVGRRYATYLNDMWGNPTFLMGLEASYTFELPENDYVHRLKLSGNVTNLADTKGFSTLVVTGNSGGFQAYPIAPRMWFVTLSAGL